MKFKIKKIQVMNKNYKEQSWSIILIYNTRKIIIVYVCFNVVFETLFMVKRLHHL